MLKQRKNRAYPHDKDQSWIPHGSQFVHSKQNIWQCSQVGSYWCSIPSSWEELSSSPVRRVYSMSLKSTVYPSVLLLTNKQGQQCTPHVFIYAAAQWAMQVVELLKMSRRPFTSVSALFFEPTIFLIRNKLLALCWFSKLSLVIGFIWQESLSPVNI